MSQSRHTHPMVEQPPHEYRSSCNSTLRRMSKVLSSVHDRTTHQSKSSSALTFAASKEVMVVTGQAIIPEGHLAGSTWPRPSVMGMMARSCVVSVCH